MIVSMSNTNDAATPYDRDGADSVTPFTATLAAAGFLMALFGVYWDDAWHTDRGRDSTLSAPHLALYAGVAAAVDSAPRQFGVERKYERSGFGGHVRERSVWRLWPWLWKA